MEKILLLGPSQSGKSTLSVRVALMLARLTLQRQLRLLYAPRQLDAERAVYALAILLSIISSVRALIELIELADLDRELTASKRDAIDSSSVTHAARKTRLAPLLELEQQLRSALGVANAGPSTDSFRAHALGLDSDVYRGAQQADADLICLPARLRGGVGQRDSVPIRCATMFAARG